MTSSRVRWLPGTEPDGAAVYARYELSAPVRSRDGWPHLVRAADWPTWYDNARWVRLEGGATELGPGMRFRWVTFGVPVRCRVTQWHPPHRLAWEGRGLGATGSHGWVFTDTPEGCDLVTEETQRGFVPRLAGALLRRRLLHHHKRWLEGLARLAAPESGGRGERPRL